MSKTKWLWLVLAVLYGSFFGWYTSFGGPLTQDEIDAYMAKIERSGSPMMQAANLRKFLEEDTGGDLVVLNAIDLYDTPPHVEGVAPGQTAEELTDKYMTYMIPALFSRASHPIFFGYAAHTAIDLANAEGMEKWTQGAVMRYRSRRDMMEIALNPEFGPAHKYKIAGMAKTIAYPLDPWAQLGDPRLVLALLFGFIGCGVSWFWAARRGQQ